jgi:hypothetical protein
MLALKEGDMAFKLERRQLRLAVDDEGLDVNGIEPNTLSDLDDPDFPVVYEALQLADGKIKKLGYAFFVPERFGLSH